MQIYTIININLINNIFDKNIDNIMKSLDIFLNKNFDIIDIIKLLIHNIKNNKHIKQDVKIRILSSIYKSYNSICNGLNNKL